MTLNEDIEFWEKASKHHGLQSKDFVLVAFGIAAGLRMAKQDHAKEIDQTSPQPTRSENND